MDSITFSRKLMTKMMLSSDQSKPKFRNWIHGIGFPRSYSIHATTPHGLADRPIRCRAHSWRIEIIFTIAHLYGWRKSSLCHFCIFIRPFLLPESFAPAAERSINVKSRNEYIYSPISIHISQYRSRVVYFCMWNTQRQRQSNSV